MKKNGFYRAFVTAAFVASVLSGGVLPGARGDEPLFSSVVYIPAVEQSRADEEEVAEEAVSEETVAEESASVSETEALRNELASLRLETEQMKARLDRHDSSLFGLTSRDGNLSVRFGGELALNGDVVTQSDAARAGYGEAKNSVGFRDIRVSASGEGYGWFQYALGVSLNSDITIRDAYVRMKNIPYAGDITFGHMFVESGLDSVQRSFDGAYGTDDENGGFFHLGRRFGASTAIYGADRRFRAFFGVFTAADMSTGTHRLNGEHSGLILNTRVTAAPILVEDSEGRTQEALHIGGSFYQLDPASTAPLIAREKGMGWTGTNPYLLSGLLLLNGRDYSVGSVEAAYQKGGFGLAGEGHFRSVEQGGNSYGASVSARQMLTRGAVRSYNRDEARFGGVKMSDDILFLNCRAREIGGGWGALEAVARWDWIEAKDMKDAACDATRTAPPIYGSLNRMTIGANWFWNENMNWHFGWERAYANAKQYGRPLKGTFDTLLIQTAIKF